MIFELLGLAPEADKELPPENAPDLALARWLEARLGRRPTWIEILELRFLIRHHARRRARWAWWRRLRPLRLPDRTDLVADFLGSSEGELLFRALGGCMEALVARLMLPDPFEGYDGRHPTTPRPSRLDRLRERVAHGGTMPLRAQAAAVIAYASWKLTGVPVLEPGYLPDMVEFLAPVHAAAVNAMSPAAAKEFAARLRAARCSDPGRRAVLMELSRIGTEAIALWPEVAPISNAPPLGLWPVPDAGDSEKQAGPIPALRPDGPGTGPTAVR